MAILSTLLFSTLLTICIIRYLFVKYDISTMSKHILFAADQLKLAFNLLLHRSCFDHRMFHMPQNFEELNVRHFEHDSESEEPVECAVCLCKIEDGDEIRELRCKHLFHRDCLDRWVGHNHNTCPLCRGHLGPHAMLSGLGEELLVFDFGSIGSSDRCTWWLR